MQRDSHRGLPSVTRPAMKFCGITRVADAWAAADLGAAAIGFVFAPASPRAIAPDAARAIAVTLPPFLQRVGVFVDDPRRGPQPKPRR